MAIIKSGLLFGLYRSASGMTFYKRKGTNSVRSKPVRSLDWEPSTLQRYYQVVFSDINDFIKSTPIMSPLIEGGWGWSRRGNGSSNLNNIIGYIFRSITRAEGGARRDLSSVQGLHQAFIANPLKYFVERCQIVATKYPLAGHAYVFNGNGNLTRISMDVSEVRKWTEKVYRMEGRFRNGSAPFALVSYGSDESGAGASLAFYKFEPSAEGYTIRINTDLIKGRIWQVCIAINENASAAVTSTSGWAISPAIASSSLRQDVPVPVFPSITSVSLNGSVVNEGQHFVFNGGDRIVISGANIVFSDLLARIVLTGGGQDSVTRFGLFSDVTSEDGSTIECTVRSNWLNWTMFDIRSADGTILYRFLGAQN